MSAKCDATAKTSGGPRAGPAKAAVSNSSVAAPTASGSTCCPTGWNVRTQVHEYGGGAWAVRSGTVVFSRWDDQRLYRFDPASTASPAR